MGRIWLWFPCAAAMLAAVALGGCASRHGAGAAQAAPAVTHTPMGMAELSAEDFDPTLVSYGSPEDPDTFVHDFPLYINDCINLARRSLNLLETSPGDRPAQRADKASQALDAVIERLRQIDQALPTDPSQWRWTPAISVPMDDAGEAREKFLVDPPLRNSSAVSFRCERRNVEILSVKVIDARGAASVFPINRIYASRQATPEIVYLYYPTDVSTIILAYSRPSHADARVSVWAGVTNLPEFAKESIYWLLLARQELDRRNLTQAGSHIRQGIQKAHLYRKSRNRL